MAADVPPPSSVEMVLENEVVHDLTDAHFTVTYLK